MSTLSQVDAKKHILKAADALALAAEVSDIYATKGKQVIHFDMRNNPPSADDLAAVLLGPTGNLRAPAVRKGKTLIVGFDEATYKNILGSS